MTPSDLGDRPALKALVDMFCLCAAIERSGQKNASFYSVRVVVALLGSHRMICEARLSATVGVRYA